MLQINQFNFYVRNQNEKHKIEARSGLLIGSVTINQLIDGVSTMGTNVAQNVNNKRMIESTM